MRLILGFALSLLLSACGGTQSQWEKERAEERAQADRQLKDEITTSASEASIVVVRELVGTKYGPEFFVDERVQCILEDNTYCILRLPAGARKIGIIPVGYRPSFEPGGPVSRRPEVLRSNRPEPVEISIDLHAGTTTFLKMQSDVGGFPLIVPLGTVIVFGAVDRTTYAIFRISQDDFLNMRPFLGRGQAYSAGSKEERMATLNNLRKRRLITDREYWTKQQEIQKP